MRDAFKLVRGAFVGLFMIGAPVGVLVYMWWGKEALIPYSIALFLVSFVVFFRRLEQARRNERRIR